ncbi:hypothetical protein I3J09_01855 [Streptomyces clavuligerus]|uniref:hypothetical protein n=1 Tax=Streptomyces clavuligerus TaxID=1901 RepID=UPI000B16D693|nr:hypothetical protein [Streptomyces clavuligerus]MBY6301425.1 hypothetical protein [Streptomyces clavuligerus]QPL66832.1 hypothetical protein I3J04_01855 [Streptomyces clavuligerus]QPL72862.1 hypothetical protein I3J05_01870 [Streptomyces clavuligerus]QPL78939.1 hypothetical protein I3J06_01865 [Streptomyces clavuligerus]QPL84966.1 hypothetical protein I3J07_01910 [Streptomyces clavuligerus]
MTSDVKNVKNTYDHLGPGRYGESTRRPETLGSLEVWARSAPIRLAGYEDDLAEPHILQGID